MERSVIENPPRRGIERRGGGLRWSVERNCLSAVALSDGNESAHVALSHSEEGYGMACCEFSNKTDAGSTRGCD
jgi:hypothetical protein